MDETNANASLDEYMYDRHSRPLHERPSEDGDEVNDGALHHITTSDGVTLAASVWDPSGRAKGHVLVIASATGVLRGYYAPFAAWLARRVTRSRASRRW
jgi:hypothetical protein